MSERRTHKTGVRTRAAKGTSEYGYIQVAAKLPPDVFDAIKAHALRTNQTISGVIRNELIVATRFWQKSDGDIK